MTTLPARIPIDGASVGRFIDAVQNGTRLCFPLDEVAPVAGVNVAYLEAACWQRLVEHISFYGAVSMTAQQVQALVFRLGPDGDLTNDVLADAYLREQSRPDRLNRHLWAVK